MFRVSTETAAGHRRQETIESGHPQERLAPYSGKNADVHLEQLGNQTVQCHHSSQGVVYLYRHWTDFVSM